MMLPRYVYATPPCRHTRSEARRHTLEVIPPAVAAATRQLTTVRHAPPLPLAMPPPRYVAPDAHCSRRDIATFKKECSRYADAAARYAAR